MYRALRKMILLPAVIAVVIAVMIVLIVCFIVDIIYSLWLCKNWQLFKLRTQDFWQQVYESFINAWNEHSEISENEGRTL